MQNKKVVKYYIVVGYSRMDLYEDVQKMIDVGWEPFGSLNIEQNEAGNAYYQPIVRYED